MGVGASNENNLPPTPSGQRPSKSDFSPVPEALLPERFLTAPQQQRKPSHELDETWGTRKRMAALISHVDQAGVDEMIDRAMRMGNPPNFMAQYHPQTHWLWRQWRGTVLQRTWPAASWMMFLSVMLVFVMEIARSHGTHTWSLFEVPNPDDKWVARMKGFTTMWGYLLTMATFVNSFFLSQAYGYWLATKGNVRKVQGRINDMSMLLASHAKRDPSGRYTAESYEMLEVIARWVRLYHMLFWAGQVRPARGDNAVSYSLLRTERGLQALQERSALTSMEFQLLIDNPAIPETARHHAVLEWILTRFLDARRGGLLDGGVGLESRFLEESCKLRAVCASIADDASARMPLSYVHLVQLLVDTLVALAPLALYPKLGVLTVLLSGILVTFYRGFLQLSKSFLDPFGNGDTLAENFSISCLLCETNAGSVRWFNAIQQLPFETADRSGRQT